MGKIRSEGVRRKEREIKSREEIESLIRQAQICRIGFCENDVSYIVPVNFGYEVGCLYFHCATQGKKLDIIQKNDKVCFEMEIDYQLVKPEGPPCNWSANYTSVIGYGRASVIKDSKEKIKALNIVTRHYGGNWYEFSSKEMERVSIVKIEIDSMTGKKAGR
jgi:nitroimidazol reductase NimA-like FMN-containing flavoprotein (pyridoxamine 5'-phosphate oxidase superfamily)